MREEARALFDGSELQPPVALDQLPASPSPGRRRRPSGSGSRNIGHTRHHEPHQLADDGVTSSSLPLEVAVHRAGLRLGPRGRCPAPSCGGTLLRAKQLSAVDRIWRRASATSSSVTFGMSSQSYLDSETRYSIKNLEVFVRPIGGDPAVVNPEPTPQSLEDSRRVIPLARRDRAGQHRQRTSLFFLPSIQQELGVSASTLQWIVDAYILVSMVLLAAGNLGDPLRPQHALQSGCSRVRARERWWRFPCEQRAA